MAATGFVVGANGKKSAFFFSAMTLFLLSPVNKPNAATNAAPSAAEAAHARASSMALLEQRECRSAGSEFIKARLEDDFDPAEFDD